MITLTNIKGKKVTFRKEDIKKIEESYDDRYPMKCKIHFLDEVWIAFMESHDEVVKFLNEANSTAER